MKKIKVTVAEIRKAMSLLERMKKQRTRILKALTLRKAIAAGISVSEAEIGTEIAKRKAKNEKLKKR